MRTFMKRLLLLMMALLFVLPLTACNSVESSYSKAQKQMAAGDYAKAAETFASLGSYEDSSTLAMYCRACAAAEAGDYRTGIAALRSMGDYKDCAMRVTYYTARQLEDAAGTSDWDAMYDAQGGYEDIPLFLDSAERIAALDARIAAAKAAEYDAAVKAGDAGQYDTTIASFRHLGAYSDSSKRAAYYGIRKDEAAFAGTTDQDKLIAIVNRYTQMGGYLDCAARAASVTAQADAVVADKYAQVDALIAEGKYTEADRRLYAFGTYGNGQISAKYLAMGNHAMDAGKWDVATNAFGKAGNAADRRTATYVAIRRDEAALAGTTDQDALIAIAKRYAELGEFLDSAARVTSVTIWADSIVADKYEQVDALLAAGDYAGAKAHLDAFGVYGIDEKPQRYCAVGDLAAIDGVYGEALAAYCAAGDCAEAGTKVGALRRMLSTRVAAGYSHTVGLRSDGTVIAVGSNSNGQCDVLDWHDIVAIAAGSGNTAALRSDGTVVVIGYKDYGHCDVSSWCDIVAIDVGSNHTGGLRSDGTVVAVGSNQYNQCDVSGWHGIVAIAAGAFHTVGLRSDGTVVAVGSNNFSQCDVSDWHDIVAIAAGSNHTVGLRSDGTVVVAGTNKYGEGNVSNWRNIVAIAAGGNHTVGLYADGAVVAVGTNDYGQCRTSDWHNVVAVAADDFNTIGLCADGTVVVAGDWKSGQCNTYSWNLFD